MKHAVTLADGTKVMRNTRPPCEWETCKGNKNGACMILTDTKFTRPCPFYKRRMRHAVR